MRWPATLALVLVAPLAGCGGDQDSVTVLAAASLTQPFTELAESFEERHPGTTVELTFGSSSSLALQVADGAPADVLATADTRTMAVARGAGTVPGKPYTFATNQMVLVTPPGNPADVHGIDDLTGATYVSCVPQAPCGRIAAAVLADAGVRAVPASHEPDVKAVLTKVTQGEADAGLVYASDAAAAGDAVATVELPHPGRHRNRYPIAVTGRGADNPLADRYVDLVLSRAGRQVLADSGFGPRPAR